jgi:hypothetical protein
MYMYFSINYDLGHGVFTKRASIVFCLLFLNSSFRSFLATSSVWGCVQLARCFLRPMYSMCWRHSWRHHVLISGVLDCCSFSLLSSSTLLIISPSVMIWRFSYWPPASQLFMAAIAGQNIQSPIFPDIVYRSTSNPVLLSQINRFFTFVKFLNYFRYST